MHSALAACRMTVFRPARRTHYVLRWTDPATGRRHEKSTKTHRKTEAYQQALVLAGRLASGHRTGKTWWIDFCGEYERLVEAKRTGRAREPWITTRGWIDRIGAPRYLEDVTTAWATRWQEALRQAGLSVNTVAGYSARLKAALRWAADQELIPRAPRIKITTEETPRSRGITPEEFERILAVVPDRRPGDTAAWQRLLRGQWESGFRIGELVALSWDLDAPVHLDATGCYPVAMVAARSTKSRHRTARPITPEFWAVCCETPPEARRGPVFPVGLGLNWIGKMLTAFGRLAGVVTNPETGKHATSHDTRRAFTGRMDSKLTMPELQKWMGHADIRTTLAYYHTADAQTLAEKLWAKSGRASGAPAKRPKRRKKDG